MKRIQIQRLLPYRSRWLCEDVAKEGKIEPTIMVHGGAGTLFDSIVISKIDGVKTAAQIGYKALIEGTAMDAVEQAICHMDNSEHFNSGKGSLLNTDGEVENDAIMMKGDITIGAVGACRDIEHPISLSRLIMEKTSHIFTFSANGALEYAQKSGMKILPPKTLVTERAKQLWEKHRQFDGQEIGIVGAVALDKFGTLVAGISSGGVNNKLPGRVCCCFSGCSVFADNTIAAIACTGEGESILRVCLAYTIAHNMQYGLSPSEAIQKGLFMMDMRLHTTGGAIALSKNGEIGFYFNTKRMAWAYQVGNTVHYGIEKGEHNTEVVKA